MDPASPVHAIVAECDGETIGIANYVIHENTSTLTPVCYLEDLFVRAPIAGDAGKLAHHQTLDVRARGFAVRGVGPVIPDLRIGQNDDLPGIGRIGEYFLVAGDGGIEDDLAGPLGGRTKTPALEDAAVFQGEDGGWQLDCPPGDWIKPILAASRPLLETGHFSGADPWARFRLPSLTLSDSRHGLLCWT